MAAPNASPPAQPRPPHARPPLGGHPDAGTDAAQPDPTLPDAATPDAAGAPRARQGLHGKVALVTGAASGLGAALAAVLAAEGCDIVAVDIRADALQAGMPALLGHGVRSRALALDVGHPGAARAAVERCIATMGRLDILVNNAGTDVTLPLSELSELRPHGIRVTAVVAGGMRPPFLLDRFPDLDPARLQDPENVALAIRHALLLPRESVIAELTILPVQETAWP